ncbi:MAG: family 16 glycoside hydrolase [Candidatus Diapherotrites archaeon]
MKKEFLLVFCLILLLNTVSAQSDAECDADSRCLFYSSWNYSTGSCGLASAPEQIICNDGGKWFGGSTPQIQEGSVSSGGPGGNNFLNMVSPGGGGRGTEYRRNWLITGEEPDHEVFGNPADIYYRVYFRVHEDYVLDGGGIHWFMPTQDWPNWVNNQFVQTISAPVDEWPALETDFSVGIGNYGDGGWYANIGMEHDRWYCWEVRQQDISATQERWTIRLDGQDITDNFFCTGGDHYGNWLGDLYDTGWGFANEPHGNIWMGTYDNYTENQGMDVAAVEVRDDHWVGCFDESCTNGETRSCSTGLDGICATGEQSCSNEEWGSCGQTVFPEAEICDDSVDNDCDGETNCADSECSSLPECQSNAVLEEDFSDGDFTDWTVVDEGTIAAPSNWNVVSGELAQSSNIFGPDSDDASPYEVYKPGSFLYYNNGMGWTDYSFSSRIRSADNDGIGVMFRYTGPDNYYRFMMDSQRNYRRLSKIVNGVESIIAEDLANGYASGQWYDLDITANGSSIVVSLNGGQIFNETDSDLSAGTIALYVWGVEGAYFDDVVVSSSSPCIPVQEICDDSSDNDCDGLVDCNDVLNCPASLPECEVTCDEVWSCGSWSSCSGGTQTRTCTDANGCGTENEKPPETQGCTVDTGLLFESNWNYSTGNCGLGFAHEQIICNDGGKWFGGGTFQDQAGSVEAGGPGGNNFLNMVSPGVMGEYRRNWHISGGDAQGDVFQDPENTYYRVYFRVHDDWQTPMNNAHWFMPNANYADQFNNRFPISFGYPVGVFPDFQSNWRFEIVNYGGDGGFMANIDPENERWYCWEVHIQEIDENMERWYVRLDGIDITSSFTCFTDSCGRGQWLQDLYDNDWGWTNEDQGNIWMAIYDQPSINSGWDVTGVQVRNDTWPGCFGPEAIVDAQDCEISISEFSALGSSVNNCTANNLEYQYEAGMAVQNWVTSLTPNMNHNVKIENLTSGTEQNLVLNSNSEGKLQFSS